MWVKTHLLVTRLDIKCVCGSVWVLCLFVWVWILCAVQHEALLLGNIRRNVRVPMFARDFCLSPQTSAPPEENEEGQPAQVPSLAALFLYTFHLATGCPMVSQSPMPEWPNFLFEQILTPPLSLDCGLCQVFKILPGYSKITHRTQVYLGSNLWARMYVTKWCRQ